MPEPHPGQLDYSENLAAYLAAKEAARTAVDNPDPYGIDDKGTNPSE
jgi:hypothetical protein